MLAINREFDMISLFPMDDYSKGGRHLETVVDAAAGLQAMFYICLALLDILDLWALVLVANSFV